MPGALSRPQQHLGRLELLVHEFCQHPRPLENSPCFPEPAQAARSRISVGKGRAKPPCAPTSPPCAPAGHFVPADGTGAGTAPCAAQHQGWDRSWQGERSLCGAGTGPGRMRVPSLLSPPALQIPHPSIHQGKAGHPQIMSWTGSTCTESQRMQEHSPAPKNTGTSSSHKFSSPRGCRNILQPQILQSQRKQEHPPALPLSPALLSVTDDMSPSPCCH